MLLLPDEFDKKIDIWLNSIWNNIYISPPNSVSDSFSSLQFWKIDVLWPVSFYKGFWQGGFFFNYFLCLVGLLQIKN